MNFVYYYHDVSSSEEFEDFILSIKSKYDIVSSEELYSYISGDTKLENSCVFTIDDGWISTYKYVFPVIKKHNIPITIFVSPLIIQKELNFWYYLLDYCNPEGIMNTLIKSGVISEKSRKYHIKSILKELEIDVIYKYLLEDIGIKNLKTIPRGFINLDELGELNASPLVTIGAHTMMHPILSNESEMRSRKEIIDSVKELSKLLNTNVTTFAYPNGQFGLDYSEREISICREAGIKMAFSTDPGCVETGSNTLRIPRIGSLNRLKYGKLGIYLPSLSNQARERKRIRKNANK